jgi:hypothetical protein
VATAKKKKAACELSTDAGWCWQFLNAGGLDGWVLRQNTSTVHIPLHDKTPKTLKYPKKKKQPSPNDLIDTSPTLIHLQH